jgi:hypothetical protein
MTSTAVASVNIMTRSVRSIVSKIGQTHPSRKKTPTFVTISARTRKPSMLEAQLKAQTPKQNSSLFSAAVKKTASLLIMKSSNQRKRRPREL